jgi:hypothetical protein
MARPSLRANAKMQLLIGGLAAASLPPLSGRILRYLAEGVIESDGAVLLKALSTGAAFDALRHRDRTGYECAINQLRFEATPAGPDRALATALTFAGQVIEMLERSGCAGPKIRATAAAACASTACARTRLHQPRTPRPIAMKRSWCSIATLRPRRDDVNPKLTGKVKILGAFYREHVWPRRFEGLQGVQDFGAHLTRSNRLPLGERPPRLAEKGQARPCR